VVVAKPEFVQTEELKTLRATGKLFKGVVDKALDRRLEEITDELISEETSTDELISEETNFCGNSFELHLVLSAGLDDAPGPEDIMENCRQIIDREGDQVDHFDLKGAEKALRKDGSIDDVYDFVSKRYDWGENIWSVDSQCGEEITDVAFKQLRFLLEGDGFRYPEDYDSFGVNEFDERFDAEEFSKLKEHLWFILCRAKSVKHSFWEGHFEIPGDGTYNVEREEFFTFSTHGGGNFVLKFRHAFLN